MNNLIYDLITCPDWNMALNTELKTSHSTVKIEISNIYNTSLNKFPVLHIDGTTVVKSIWFLDSTNLQALRVTISW